MSILITCGGDFKRSLRSYEDIVVAPVVLVEGDGNGGASRR